MSHSERFHVLCLELEAELRLPGLCAPHPLAEEEGRGSGERGGGQVHLCIKRPLYNRDPNVNPCRESSPLKGPTTLHCCIRAELLSECTHCSQMCPVHVEARGQPPFLNVVPQMSFILPFEVASILSCLTSESLWSCCCFPLHTTGF